MKIVYLIFLTAMIHFNVFAINYYVAQKDPNDNNSNPGTEALPFETIQAVADIADDCDIVFVKAGTYRETVTPANSGLSGSLIVFQVYGNDNVTISGADENTGWTLNDSQNVSHSNQYRKRTAKFKINCPVKIVSSVRRHFKLVY